MSNKANWPCVALGLVTRPESIREVKQWIKENVHGRHSFRIIKETSPKTGRQSTIAVFVRFEREDDKVLFNLTWYNHQ